MAIPLVALGTLALVLWVIALAAAIAVIMGYIAGALHGLPFPLNQLAGPVEGLAKGITKVCGKLEAGVDHLIGASWHWLARYMDTLWKQHASYGALLATFGKLIGNHILDLTGLRSLVHRLEKVWHGIEHGVKTLTKEFHGIERRVLKLEREIGKGIGHDLRIQVKALEGEVAHVENVVVPNIRSIANTAEAEVTGLEKWIAQNLPAVGTDAFTAAIAVALGALGLGGLRCNGLLNSLKNRGCGLWNGIEDLLGLFVDTLLLTNVCTILPFLEAAVSEVADPIVIALTDVGAGLCSGGIGAAPALHVPALSLPANPGVALHLP